MGDYRWRRHNDGPMAGSICGVELYLPRHEPGKFLGQTNIDNMLNKLLSHPMVAFGTMQQDSRKLKRTTVADHESWYNITFTTNFNTSMTLGYSHADDAAGMTHLWALCPISFTVFVVYSTDFLVFITVFNIKIHKLCILARIFATAGNAARRKQWVFIIFIYLYVYI